MERGWLDTLGGGARAGRGAASCGLLLGTTLFTQPRRRSALGRAHVEPVAPRCATGSRGRGQALVAWDSRELGRRERVCRTSTPNSAPASRDWREERGSLAGRATPLSYAVRAPWTPTLALASGSICGAPMRTPSYKRSPHGSQTLPYPIPGRSTCGRYSHCTRRTINPRGHGRPSDGHTAPPVVA